MAAEPPITDADLAALVATMDEAAAAYIDGEIEHYLSLFDHGDDYTLMPPYGGPTVRGFERTDEGLAATKAFFASGEGRFDCQQTYASGDLAVLVGVERQRRTSASREEGDRERTHAERPLAHRGDEEQRESLRGPAVGDEDRDDAEPALVHGLAQRSTAGADAPGPLRVRSIWSSGR